MRGGAITPTTAAQCDPPRFRRPCTVKSWLDFLKWQQSVGIHFVKRFLQWDGILFSWGAHYLHINLKARYQWKGRCDNISSGFFLIRLQVINFFLTFVVLGKWVCFLDFEYKFVQTMAIGIANFLSANKLKVKFKTGISILFFKIWLTYYIHSCWAFFIRYKTSRYHCPAVIGPNVYGS